MFKEFWTAVADEELICRKEPSKKRRCAVVMPCIDAYIATSACSGVNLA